MKLFGWLRRSAAPDDRSLDQLIFDLAEFNVRRADRRELYRRLSKIELFASVTSTNINVPSGTTLRVGAADRLSISTSTSPAGHTLVTYFIDKDDPRLLPQFVVMTVVEACRMALRASDLDGLLLQGRTSYYGMLKPEVDYVLHHVLQVGSNRT